MAPVPQALLVVTIISREYGSDLFASQEHTTPAPLSKSTPHRDTFREFFGKHIGKVTNDWRADFDPKSLKDFWRRWEPSDWRHQATA
jgi:hypothetical protein